ncbi:MAG: hypothetical protein ABIN94_06760 [Ferruginibacter sp.]
MLIKEVQLLTNDLAQTKLFYQDMLGLQLVQSGHDQLIFQAGLSRLIFILTRNDMPCYHFAFNLPNNQLEAALRWMSSKIPLMEISPGNVIADFINWNAKAFYFFDNNKNIVEMITRFDLDNASGNPFDGSAIQSVSEVGIVVEDPGMYALELKKKYGIDFYSKQQPARDFIAVGNDEGLLIIVSQNRKWYPTNIRSANYWCKLTLQLAEANMEITI